MHNALSIPEVLGIVTGCLAEEICFPNRRGYEDPSRHALAVLARTCRAFSKPALDTLWRKLDGLRPFLLSHDRKSLPAFNEEEWHIVLHYAPRVRELMLEDDNTSLEILQSACFRTTLLLPNLRKLQWVYKYSDGPALPWIRLLLSPSLVHLDVWLEDGPIPAFLDHYHTFCPDLRSLHFRHSVRERYPGRSTRLYHVPRKTASPSVNISHFPHTAAISRAIRRSPNVEILYCDSIDEDGLAHIAQSRYLKRFSCNLLDHEPDALRGLAGCGIPDYPPFENLRILGLRIEDLSSIIPFLKSQNQPFEEVSFKAPMPSTPEVLHEFFAALGSTTRHRTLRRIKLQSIDHSRRLEVPGHAVDFQVLSPLMGFDLRTLDIDVMNPLSLNDEEFVGLVQAWPELERLHFNTSSGWGYPPSVQLPTLRGLVHVLARCPRLHDLGFCFDAIRMPSLSKDELLIRNTAITRLFVSNSPVQSPVARVTRFLLEHLPSLKGVMLSDFSSEGMEYHWAWREVEEEIKQVVGQTSRDWETDSDSDSDSDDD